ncbi:MAG: hypothetical protein V8S34_01410 [Lawsonibacter sp.]
MLRNRYPQVIQPFALGYNVVYTVLSAAYVIFLDLSVFHRGDHLAPGPGGVFHRGAGGHGVLHLEGLAPGPAVKENKRAKRLPRHPGSRSFCPTIQE